VFGKNQCRVIEDTGSGLKYKRKGLGSILELAMSGNLKELVVASREGLARFAKELITWPITRSGGRVFFNNQINAVSRTPEMELTENLLAIITVFSCRLQGRRRYGSKKHESQGISNKNAKWMDRQMSGWSKSA